MLGLVLGLCCALCWPATMASAQESSPTQTDAGTQAAYGKPSDGLESNAKRSSPNIDSQGNFISRGIGLRSRFDPFAQQKQTSWDEGPLENIAAPQTPRISSRLLPTLPFISRQDGGFWPSEDILPGESWQAESQLLGEPLWTEPYCVDCEFAGAPGSQWRWQLLPGSLIYSSYLAGVKESRLAATWFYDDHVGWQWDSTLGARVGVLRYGTGEDFPYYPQGWQLDIEGAGMPRLDLEDGRRDLVSSDFRVGVPLTYGRGRYQAKFAYYHLSAHLGDEFLLRTGATRINFVRDVLVWGNSYYLSDALRAYGEVGYGIHVDGGSKPWEFQFGLDFAPACPTGFSGAPFFAVNGYLREEFDFGGNFVAQAGWAWRSRRGGPLARIGVQYYNGKSSQWELFDTFEEQIGLGMWYDF